ncbi:isocitrate lyase/PEP mutase family protein [Hwanghaeella sp.]|uniref:isocitrate lyase/PEP mutase family protein n=1 Tax=Hwanghaeella sp. TaxID=2605943 RepID=UPI003CCBEF92
MAKKPRGRKSLLEVFRDHDIVLAPGAYDVMSARLIEQSGSPLVYLSGLANEASDLGYPDLGFTNAVEIIRKAGAISRVVDTPVVCDADTGFGGPVNVARTVREFEAAGVSAIHLEDQVFPKRCGVLAGKEVVDAKAFAQVIGIACDSRKGDDFSIIARSDAKGTDGVDGVIDRLRRYVDAGADAVMLGDFYTARDYEKIVLGVNVPVVACAVDKDNYDKQPDYSRDEWRSMGVKMVVYWHLPLFAAMRAVREAVEHLSRHGSLSEPSLAVDGYKDYARAVDLDSWMDLAGDGS